MIVSCHDMIVSCINILNFVVGNDNCFLQWYGFHCTFRTITVRDVDIQSPGYKSVEYFVNPENLTVNDAVWIKEVQNTTVFGERIIHVAWIGHAQEGWHDAQEGWHCHLRKHAVKIHLMDQNKALFRDRRLEWKLGFGMTLTWTLTTRTKRASVSGNLSWTWHGHADMTSCRGHDACVCCLEVMDAKCPYV